MEVPGEAVDLFFHRFLEAFHDEERNDRRRKTYRYADDSNFVDGG
jgi:hypothetical protein